jgi:hypothetical protein
LNAIASGSDGLVPPPAGRTGGVFLLYCALAILMTWPLAAGLASDVPADLGDSLLNMWILAWGAEQFPRVITGAISFREFWNANIFHPELLTLGFSEHLFAQVLQILPIYHATDNVILCYNLLVLSNFALSGFGMFLLVRDLTGSTSAAFLAGVVYAFTPFRFAQLPHIQVMSSQWMPLALYGFRRHITTGRLLPLIGGSAALLMQNWACGYYMLFFAPFVVLFVIHQIVVHGHGRSLRVWTHFAGAATAVFAGSWPFLAMYLATQQAHGLVRPFGEVVAFSANLHGYLTAPEILRLWGSTLRLLPKAEGELFLGFVAMLLGLFAVLSALNDARRAAPRSEGLPRWRRLAIVALAVAGGLIAFALFSLVIVGGFISRLGGLPLRATNASRLMIEAVLILGGLVALSPRARDITRSVVRNPAFLAAVSVVGACWLSLGPLPMSGIRRMAGLGLYNVFYDFVPGFDGVRAPARFAMVAAMFLAMLAGLGAARLRVGRGGRPLIAVLTVVVLIESWSVPLPMNLPTALVRPLPARIYPPHSAPPVYRAIASLPERAVVAELPFGEATWELRYVYYSTVHWRRLVNGYSGFFPAGYAWRSARLSRLPERQNESWNALTEAGTTHVVLHRDGFSAEQADQIVEWLESKGAHELGRFGSDVLFELGRQF